VNETSPPLHWKFDLIVLDRLKEIDKPKEIEAWTSFKFPSRGGKYSSMKYHWNHFSGIDRDTKMNERGVFKFVGSGKQGWAADVSEEFGNYDYLCAHQNALQQSRD
jgi:alpha-amylase